MDRGKHLDLGFHKHRDTDGEQRHAHNGRGYMWQSPDFSTHCQLIGLTRLVWPVANDQFGLVPADTE